MLPENMRVSNRHRFNPYNAVTRRPSHQKEQQEALPALMSLRFDVPPQVRNLQNGAKHLTVCHSCGNPTQVPPRTPLPDIDPDTMTALDVLRAVQTISVPATRRPNPDPLPDRE